MNRKKSDIKKNQRPSVFQLGAILAASLMLFQFSLFFISDRLLFLDTSGILKWNGLVFVLGLLLLDAGILLFYKFGSVLYRILISVEYLAVPVLAVTIDPQNITVIIFVTGISLFLLFYLFNYRENLNGPKDRYWRVGILFNLVLLAMLIFSAKYGLFTIFWNKISILAYMFLYSSYIVYFLVRTESNKRYAKMIVIGSAYAALFFIFFLINDFFIISACLVLLFQLYLLLHSIQYDRHLIDMLFENPYKLLINSFAGVIFLASILLTMPFASSDGKAISYIDSLFTVTSAVCVTGLTVLDTYKDFSLAGQIIILICIQTGGLGIVTIMTFISVFLGKFIGFEREFIISEVVGSQRPKMVYKLIKVIILSTIIIEGIGALCITIFLYTRGLGIAESFWKGIFHAISAFCNAGFALQTDNLIQYNQTVFIPMIIAILIILGGIGFPVIMFYFDKLTGKGEFRRTPIFVKIPVIMTALLLASGYIVFIFAEYNHSLAGLRGIDKHVNAFLLSVTPRTAGFNAVDMGQVSDISIFYMFILMFIGAGSCSTGGGIKITTVGVLWSVVLSYIRNYRSNIIFKFKIPSGTVARAVVLFILSIVLVFLVTCLLLASQNLEIKESLFEVLSAFGTVGLSIGATMKLDTFGKFLIILMMFLGRVGILTFISLAVPPKPSRVEYSEEAIMIG